MYTKPPDSMHDRRTCIPIIAVLSFVVFVGFPSLLFAEVGRASYYGNGEKLNKHTANGEVFRPESMTCASYAYPMNTTLEVTNQANGKQVLVRVNDLGPNKRLGRLIDLSKGAFERIAPLKEGVIRVKVTVVQTKGN